VARLPRSREPQLRASDRDRYLIERSLEISSTEMAELYDQLRRSSESELAAERDKLRTVIESIGDGLSVLDATGLILFANPEARRLLACPDSAVAGRRLWEVVRVREDDDPQGALGESWWQGSLGCVAERSVLRGDRDSISQVFDNLISNALKFTAAGGTVCVTVREEDGDAMIEVADTGIGIPETEQERLFQRFFRASSASQRHIAGVGLGLSIVRAIVEAHGGSIDFSSVHGAGTTFRVRLPLAAPVHDHHPVRTAAAALQP
jgi:signal transduction histidine kinase